MIKGSKLVRYLPHRCHLLQTEYDLLTFRKCFLVKFSCQVNFPPAQAHQIGICTQKVCGCLHLETLLKDYQVLLEEKVIQMLTKRYHHHNNQLEL